MKSGTNAYHGNVFEFLRNSATDAHALLPTRRRRQADLSAESIRSPPSAVRCIKDRTFFFGSWQSSREQSQAPQIASVPTATSSVQGIFPSKVTDPTTGAAFPNNAIPVSRFDPVAKGLVALYPLPDLTGIVNNFFSNPKEVLNSRPVQSQVRSPLPR